MKTEQLWNSNTDQGVSMKIFSLNSSKAKDKDLILLIFATSEASIILHLVNIQ